MITHPLASWVEEAFGLAFQDDRLVRRTPLAFQAGLHRLVAETGLAEDCCRDRLRAVLEAGNAATLPRGEPVFAFRLHQFLASGGSVYATLEAPGRALSTERVYAPKRRGRARCSSRSRSAASAGRRRIWYRGSRAREERLVPRSPLLNAPDDEIPGEALLHGRARFALG